IHGGIIMNIERIQKLLFEFCGVPSISETSGELAMARVLYDRVSELQYFKDNPGNMAIDPINGDRMNRTFFHALMEGGVKSSETVILLSHFDVVDITDYGSYKDYAFNPPEYTGLLKKDGSISLSQEAREDLDSGDYIFGRGTMDMKFGIALDVEIMYQVQDKLDYFPGNILLLSVPDEENNSAGMLAAVELLAELKKEKGLEYVCCLVSEPHFPKYPGDDNKYIYTGTIGKLLPVFFCFGKETHAGDPFSGLNPNMLTGKIIEKLELNPDLSDAVEGFRVPAPVCLKQADVKAAYSVSTPAAAYAYFNFMTIVSSPDEILEKLRYIGEEAFVEVLGNIRNRADRLQALTGSKPKLPEIKPMVVTFQELYAMSLKARGNEFSEHMSGYMKELPAGDLRELSLDVVREVHKFCPYREPMIVLFFAPPYYPHSGLDRQAGKVAAIAAAIMKKAEAEYGEKMTLEPFFPGLSDMSYLGLPDNINTGNLKANFPLWGDRYTIPLDVIAGLSIPFMNIGPLGKDAHKYTERLCVSYSFNKASKLVFEAVLDALDINPAAFGL
ncbi:MAG TPA: M20/M25/M40 family metallo-hydrolase, partial [Clostridia bacterium]|nr:M20/M25/M40 family metallo-hydrolase [Clostridia bacterium]